MPFVHACCPMITWTTTCHTYGVHFHKKILPKHFNYGNIYHNLVESVTFVDFSIACCDNDDNDEDQTGPSYEDLHTSSSQKG